ncbi:hypothetical protein Q092_01193 [Pseudomonas aeruginosa CF77]|nr:hypothetical protein Q092_01193 [Pseudomonas aeruginosa CF77]
MLEYLVRSCHGDDRPDCPIIESPASETTGNPEKGGGDRSRRGKRHQLVP